jgi:hypothetical protein
MMEFSDSYLHEGEQIEDKNIQASSSMQVGAVPTGRPVHGITTAVNEMHSQHEGQATRNRSQSLCESVLMNGIRVHVNRRVTKRSCLNRMLSVAADTTNWADHRPNFKTCALQERPKFQFFMSWMFGLRSPG